MADDTRQNGQEAATTSKKRKHDFPQTQAGKMWEKLGNPAEPANSMPGGTYNSAGGKPPAVSWLDAFNFSREGKSYSWYQAPCARDSLLVGMGAGSAVGGLRFILRGELSLNLYCLDLCANAVSGLSSTLATANWAVGGFTVAATSMYYWCDQRRREEARGMAVAVQGMKMLHEKKAREKAAAEETARATVAEAEEKARKRKEPWYKFW
jgi:cytochrome c oxidase assembly protein subunit 20